MKWIELISLRSIHKDREWLECGLNELIDKVKRENGDLTITLYKRVLVDSDIGVHISHNSGKIENGGSRLGLHLAAVLKEYGMVHHSIWIEIESG